MSDEPEQTHSERDIVLELFPATPDRLIPQTKRFALEPASDGSVVLREAGCERLRFYPVASAGNRTAQLCCDLCHHADMRRFLQLLRVEVPGSNGRRFRYLIACRDHEACELRRGSDAPIEQLLRQTS